MKNPRFTSSTLLFNSFVIKDKDCTGSRIEHTTVEGLGPGKNYLWTEVHNRVHNRDRTDL